MQSQAITLEQPIIDLPKTWENSKVFIEFPDNETVIVKKARADKKPINYAIDDKNWSAIKNEAQSTRNDIFKQFYPELYDEKQKA